MSQHLTVKRIRQAETELKAQPQMSLTEVMHRLSAGYWRERAVAAEALVRLLFFGGRVIIIAPREQNATAVLNEMKRLAKVLWPEKTFAEVGQESVRGKQKQSRQNRARVDRNQHKRDGNPPVNRSR